MSSEKPFRFKFFLPDARLLGKDEIESIRTAKNQPATAVESEGLWLEIKCPDRSCLDKEGRISLPTQKGDAQDKGVFLNLFCPEESCEVVQSSDVP